jgi:dimethylamine/trimethylamine dehydrogenase
VILTEARREFGGRVSLESNLPGLSEWARVRDWRLHQIGKLPQVSLYPESTMTVDDILEVAADYIVLATGAIWRKDGRGRSHRNAVAWPDDIAIKSVDDLLAGDLPMGEVLVYDDDWYYMAAQVAHRLALGGCRVTLATSASAIATWMRECNPADQQHLVDDLRSAGVELRVNQQVVTTTSGKLALHCSVSDRQEIIEPGCIVPVTEREPVDTLYTALLADGRLGPDRLTRIGDCLRPSIIADAVHSGHLFARSFDSDTISMKRDRVVIGETAIFQE